MSKSINDYIEVSQLESKKDYEALEIGEGFIVSSTEFPTGVIHTKAEANIIALLIFAHDVPRGDHYHHSKVEYMVVLRGKLKCSFFLPESPKETEDMILEAGQQVCILPGCAHTYTAIDGDVYALEYAPQKFKMADVITVN